jgi:hypothetical protein
VDLYINSPKHFYGVVVNYFSTGKILGFTLPGTLRWAHFLRKAFGHIAADP